MMVAVILASGRGTRLRPLSTLERPKQYLDVISGNTLVEDTIDRIKDIIPYENIFLVTNILQKDLVNELFSFLPKENIILEPDMKETLASMSHAASYVAKKKGDDCEILYLPSDHYVREIDVFKSSINEGIALLRTNNNFVLYGLKPTDPNPNYGYIETKLVDNTNIITKFIEKPKLEIAETIYNKPNYFWNNGIMLTTKELVFDAIKEVLPEQYDLLLKLHHNEIDTNTFFNKTHVDNFSRSILENRKNMVLANAKYTWYDIGSFEVLFEVLNLLGKNEKIAEIKELIESNN